MQAKEQRSFVLYMFLLTISLIVSVFVAATANARTSLTDPSFLVGRAAQPCETAAHIGRSAWLLHNVVLEANGSDAISLAGTAEFLRCRATDEDGKAAYVAGDPTERVTKTDVNGRKVAFWSEQMSLYTYNESFTELSRMAVGNQTSVEIQQSLRLRDFLTAEDQANLDRGVKIEVHLWLLPKGIGYYQVENEAPVHLGQRVWGSYSVNFKLQKVDGELRVALL